MRKKTLRDLLDFIPLVILTISAILLIIERLKGNILFQWEHIVGLLILPIIYFSFFKLHKLGVVASGITLILGLIGILSFSPTIQISSVMIGGEAKIYIFYGQPIFLLWLLIHFILSLRLYFGVVTKKYWTEVMEELKKNKN